MKNTFKTSASTMMKMSFVMIPAMLILFSAFTPPTKKGLRKRQGNISFQTDVLHFGEVEPGKAYSKSVTFTNNGTDPIKIYDCMSTCGAYVAEFPKKAIKPGETATIKVIYAPRKTYGFFSKSIIIESNSRNGHDYIYIQGTVANPQQIAKN